MILHFNKLWQRKRAVLAAGAAALLLLTGQGGAEAAMKVPEDIYQWVQSSQRANFFFNKKAIQYAVDSKGEINLDVLEIPVLKSFDATQIQDVLEKRRWKQLEVEPYANLAGQAEYVRFDTRLQLVHVDELVMLDNWMNAIETSRPGQTLDLQKLSDKHWEKLFYAGVRQYAAEHQEEIVAQTGGKLKPADAERLAKEKAEREKLEKKLKKQREKEKKQKNKGHYQQIEEAAKAQRAHEAG